jgi:hypothetical protein
MEFEKIRSRQDTGFSSLPSRSSFFRVENRVEKQVEPRKSSKSATLPSSDSPEKLLSLEQQIKLEHPDFNEQDVLAYLAFLSFKKQRADLYAKLAKS